MPWLPTPVLPLFHSLDGSPNHREVQGCHGYFPADQKAVGVGYGHWERGEEELGFYEGFRVLFDHPPEGREGGERLFQLRQDGQTTAVYTFTFRTVAASSGWNEQTLNALLRRGLRKEVQTELAFRDEKLTLDTLIAMAIGIPNTSLPPSLTFLSQSLNPWR